MTKAAAHRTLAEKLQQDAGMTFVQELVAMLDGLEAELRQSGISAENQQCTIVPITGQPVGRFISDSRGSLWVVQLALIRHPDLIVQIHIHFMAMVQMFID
ncbi:hypothetical protein HV336_04030 [Citrobacter freundii]|uniref:hypothetical protein n=1 Tax=Citrobacter freundii TaxID=546 RepID=UPI0015E9D266|nr:hypothetical protein HV336_04030 [Citrobacter freundii]